jgi:hypothetical protein
MQYTIECPETERTLLETMNPFAATKIRCEDCDRMHDYDECSILRNGMEIRSLK